MKELSMPVFTRLGTIPVVRLRSGAALFDDKADPYQEARTSTKANKQVQLFTENKQFTEIKTEKDIKIFKFTEMALKLFTDHATCCCLLTSRHLPLVQWPPHTYQSVLI